MNAMKQYMIGAVLSFCLVGVPSAIAQADGHSGAKPNEKQLNTKPAKATQKAKSKDKASPKPPAAVLVGEGDSAKPVSTSKPGQAKVEEKNTRGSEAAKKATNRRQTTSLKNKNVGKRLRLKSKIRKAIRKKKRGRKSRRQPWPTSRPKMSTKVPPLGPPPYAPGERLLYQVKMFGAVAGEAVFAVGQPSTVKGRAVQPVAAFIRGSEFLNKIYPVNNRLDALLDAKTMLPIKSDFFIREKGIKSDYHTVYDHGRRFIRSIRVKKGKKVYRNFTPSTDIYELLSSLFGVRRMDLKVGMSFNYYIWDSRKERLITVKVAAEETIVTEAGTFDTLRLDISAQVTGGFIKKRLLKSPVRSGKLWLAKDRYRTPVKVITPTKLGDAEAVLVRRYLDQESSP